MKFKISDQVHFKGFEGEVLDVEGGLVIVAFRDTTLRAVFTISGRFLQYLDGGTLELISTPTPSTPDK